MGGRAGGGLRVALYLLVLGHGMLGVSGERLYLYSISHTRPSCQFLLEFSFLGLKETQLGDISDFNWNNSRSNGPQTLGEKSDLKLI